MSDDLRIETAESLSLADCRRLVLASEPWITLGYGEAEAESIVRSSATDNLIVARAGGRVVGFAPRRPASCWANTCGSSPSNPIGARPASDDN